MCEINWPLAIRGKLIEQTYPHFTVTLEILSNSSISDKDMIFIFAHEVEYTKCIYKLSVLKKEQKIVSVTSDCP